MKKIIMLAGLIFVILYGSNTKAQQSCESKIKDTKWYYKSDSIDDVYLIFRGNGRFESAEEDANIYYGYYKCSGDTVITIDESSKYDKKKFRKSVVISILKDNQLIPIYSKWDNLKARTKFDKSCIMYKDTTYKVRK